DGGSHCGLLGKSVENHQTTTAVPCMNAGLLPSELAFDHFIGPDFLPVEQAVAVGVRVAGVSSQADFLDVGETVAVAVNSSRETKDIGPHEGTSSTVFLEGGDVPAF